MPSSEPSSKRSSRRSRSRSRDKKTKRSKSPDRGSRSSRRHRSRSPRRREREQTPPEVRVARVKERELEKLERATTTVFVYNLNLRAEERDIYEFFSKAGKVTDIKLITDKFTRKSKGFAYVEFSKAESVYAALGLSGQVLMGQAVMVKASEAEKNLAWEAQQQSKLSQQAASTLLAAAPVSGSAPLLIQVFGLHTDLKEGDVKQLFMPFGTLDYVQVVRNAEGLSLGYANLQYQKADEASRAIKYWDGRTLGEMTLNVKVASQLPAAAAAVATGLSATGGAGQGATNAQQAAAPAPAPAADVVFPGEIDDDDEGLKLNAQARASLMAKLASGAGLAPVQAAAQTPVMMQNSLPTVKVDPNVTVIQGLLGPGSPIPTPCVLLKNMFIPEEMERDANLEAEIIADVRDATRCFGQLEHIFVDKASKGCVYTKFPSVAAAQGAFQTLNGRWYSERQIAAEFQFLQVYNNFFKL